MVLTETGKLSRYLYGIRFKTRDMRLALTEASDGKVGSISDRVLLFCFHYDPSEKSYVPFATNIMRDPEFGEGVRALLIDKDRNPSWQFAALDDIPEGVVDKFFTEPWTQNPLHNLAN